MADAKFDKDGNIENIAELTVEEVDAAHKVQKAKVFNRATTAEQLADEREKQRLQLETDLKAEREKNAKPKEDEKPSVDADELKLTARGLSDEEIDEAKAIAKGRGISLLEAIKTKSFTLFQADLKETARKEKARLGAGKGSGEGGEDGNDEDEDSKPITKRDLTREDHQKLFKRRLGK